MRKVLVGLVVLCAVVVLAGVVRGQCEGRFVDGPGRGMPGVNGTVACAVEWDPDGDGPMASWLVVGGSFNIAGGVMASNIAAWDGGAWHALGSGFSGAVTDVAVHNGGLYACGTFASTYTQTRVARWSGGAWAVVPSVDNVSRLWAFGGELILGRGSGSGVGAVRAYDGSTVRVLGVTSTQDGVHAFATVQGVLYALWDDRLYALVNGFWQAVGPYLGVGVRGLIEHNGEPVLAGYLSLGGTGSTYVARWDGTAWRALGAQQGLSNQLSIASYGGDPYLFFDSGATAKRWNGTGWVNAPFPHVSRMERLVSYRGEMVGLGNELVNELRRLGHVARYDGARWRVLGDGFGVTDLGGSEGVRVVASAGASLYVGGQFYQDSPAPLTHVAQWSGDHWESVGQGLGALSAQTRVSCMLADGGGVIVGGSFQAPATVRNVARWDGAAWTQLGDGWPGGPVNALGRWSGAVVAGGSGHIGRWDGAAWVDIAPAFTGGVTALLEYRGELIAAGNFAATGGETFRFLARWDGAQWRALGGGLNGAVSLACVHDGSLYVRGAFTMAAGQAADGFAKWDGEGWESVPTTGLPSQNVYAMRSHIGRLVVGGDSSYISGNQLVGRGFLRRLSGAAWQPLVADTDGGVFGLEDNGGALIAVGRFHTVGGTASNGVARYVPAPTASFSRQPWVEHAPDRFGREVVVRATISGGEPFTYAWRRNGVTISNGGAAGVWGASGACEGVSGSPCEAVLAFSSFGRSSVGVYDLVISDNCGSSASEAVVVDFQGGCSLADIGGRGGVEGPDYALDNNDFIVFIERFFAGDARADVGGDGGPSEPDGLLNNNDFVSFIGVFFQGCG